MNDNYYSAMNPGSALWIAAVFALTSFVIALTALLLIRRLNTTRAARARFSKHYQAMVQTPGAAPASCYYDGCHLNGKRCNCSCMVR